MARTGPVGPPPSAPNAAASAPPGSAPPAPVQVALAFAAVYVIWGSTYLAIRIAIETIPPFTMAAARFLVAGALLYAWVRLRIGGPAPTREHWRNAAFLGVLLLGGGNGGVVWAEQWVPSGLAALLVAMLPVWMVLADWFWGSGARPGPRLTAGLLWGLMGVALLASGEGFGAGTPWGLVGGLVVMAGGMCWAIGSIRARTIALPAPMALVTAMQMLAGGAFLLLLGVATGELGRIDPAAISARSALATLYLCVFGSLVAFSAYVWLNSVVSPARVSTYAYVNPVVALLLGWAFGGEALTGRTLLAAGVILSAVVVITRRGGEAAAQAPETPPLLATPGEPG